MSGLDFRRKIVQSDIEFALANKNLLTNKELIFVENLNDRITKGYLRPEDLTQDEFNELQIATERMQ